MAQKPVLGKGLASLLPSSAGASQELPAEPSSSSFMGASVSPQTEVVASRPQIPSVETISSRDRHLGITVITLEEIKVNPLQPRRDFEQVALQELAQSIRTNGIIQPLVVRKLPKDGYELIAGERRLRAARLAGLKQVPVVLRKSTDRESLEVALIENIQRQNLNCIDEALAYFRLVQDYGLTQEEIAEQVGKDRASVANFLRLLRLPEVIIDDLRKQILSFGHGKAILGLEDTESRMKARAEVIEKRLSVRETEALVDMMRKSQGSTRKQEVEPRSAVAQRLFNLAQDLTRHCSAKVEIKGSDRKGKIVIHYGSRDDLERVIQNLRG